MTARAGIAALAAVRLPGLVLRVRVRSLAGTCESARSRVTRLVCRLARLLSEAVRRGKALLARGNPGPLVTRRLVGRRAGAGLPEAGRAGRERLAISPVCLARRREAARGGPPVCRLARILPVVTAMAGRHGRLTGELLARRLTGELLAVRRAGELPGRRAGERPGRWRPVACAAGESLGRPALRGRHLRRPAVGVRAAVPGRAVAGRGVPRRGVAGLAVHRAVARAVGWAALRGEAGDGRGAGSVVSARRLRRLLRLVSRVVRIAGGRLEAAAGRWPVAGVGSVTGWRGVTRPGPAGLRGGRKRAAAIAIGSAGRVDEAAGRVNGRRRQHAVGVGIDGPRVTSRGLSSAPPGNWPGGPNSAGPPYGEGRTYESRGPGCPG